MPLGLLVTYMTEASFWIIYLLTYIISWVAFLVFTKRRSTPEDIWNLETNIQDKTQICHIVVLDRSESNQNLHLFSDLLLIIYIFKKSVSSQFSRFQTAPHFDISSPVSFKTASPDPEYPPSLPPSLPF